MKKNVSMYLLLAILALSCKKDAKPLETVALPVINSIFKNYYEGNLKLNPLNATFAGDNRYNDQLPIDISQEHINKAKTFYQSYLDTLKMYNAEALQGEEKLSKAILEWDLNQQLQLLSLNNELIPINQFWGLPLTMGQLGSGQSAQPFKTVKDYENWLSRLEKFTVWCDTAQANMKRGVAKGYVLQKPLIEKVIPQLEGLSKLPAEENLFFMPVKNMPAEFTADEKSKITEAYTKLITEKLVPTITALNEYVKTDYLAAGRETDGIEGLPNGKEAYAKLIKFFTTTDMTAEQIHQLGLNEVERIAAEMEKVKEQVGFKGDLKAFFNQVRNKKELMPFKDPQQVIDNFNAIHEKMKPNLAKLFDLTPKTQFEVRRTEAFREASASAEYSQGSLDGTRPGIFYVPIPNVREYNYYADEDLFLHEAIPGHHYQVSLQQENTNLPEFRKTGWYSAYGEGWALYTESLGKELGLYDDPYQYFGMLGAEMHRAIRLVVDTGLHAKGWTREQAIQYSLDNEAESEASVISEIERYMVIPAQALSYKIGQLKILELRAKAEKEMGDKFSIKEFHNKVLESGSLPLALLEEKINGWIASAK